MTFAEYQAEAIKTRKGSADAMYLAAKLPIEAGEAAQHIVKEAYHGKGEKTQVELADYYKVHQSTINSILLGKTWRHVK